MKKMYCIFILFAMLFSISAINAQTVNFYYLIKKSDFSFNCTIPADETKANEIITERNIVIDDYHKISNLEMKYPIEVFQGKPYYTVNATDSITVVPGTYQDVLIAEANSTTLNEVELSIIKYTDINITSENPSNISPEDWASKVQVNKVSDIRTLHDFTGSVEVKLVAQNTIKTVNFVNGKGIVNLSDVEGLSSLSGITFNFDIQGININLWCEKKDGVFKTPKYLK